MQHSPSSMLFHPKMGDCLFLQRAMESLLARLCTPFVWLQNLQPNQHFCWLCQWYVCVKEAVVSSPSLVFLAACRINSCNSSKESIRNKKPGVWERHWCQHTWLEVFIKPASSMAISLSFVQAEMLV